MSYTTISTSTSSRSGSPDSLSSPSGRRTSEFPLLPTSHSHSPASDEKEFTEDDERHYAWSRTNQAEGKKKGWKRMTWTIALLVPTLLTLVGLAYAANEHDHLPIAKVPSWIKGQFRSKAATATLLVPRVGGENGTRFSYYPDPLTNPVFPRDHLDFDDKLTIENLATSVPASTSSSLVFHCAHTNLTYCAEAYRVVFMGPTMHSPSWTESVQLDERRVEVRFNLTDPGDYTVYAWPEHNDCSFSRPELHGWKIRPYFRLAVSGTPAKITVEGSAPVDATRACTLEDDLTNGRWISRKHIAPEHLLEDSPLYDWIQSHLDPAPTSLKTLTDYRKMNYIFANYDCKLQHHTFEEYANEIKFPRMLFLGDSITRDQFCMNYGVADQTRGACFYEKWDAPYHDRAKQVPLLRHDGGTSHLSFTWQPKGNPNETETYLRGLPAPAPSHIFFEVGVWLTEKYPTPEGYVDAVRPFVQALTTHAPNSTLMTRTITSAVQPNTCYDQIHIQRRTIEPANRAFLQFMKDEFPHVTVLDSYKLYDNRPEASEDGRHWERVQPDPKWSKPEEGAVTYAMTDIIFSTWAMQKDAARRASRERS